MTTPNENLDRRILGRRAFLTGSLGGALGLMLARPLSALGGDGAAASSATAKSCVLVWLQGAASQLETFDPKPGTLTGGPTRAIDTAVRGLKFAEHLPALAERARKLAVVRSMTSREGDHGRASYLIHTGYVPSTTIRFPTLGSVLAAEGRQAARTDVPSFVCLGPDQVGPGYRGVENAAFVVDGGNDGLARQRSLDDERLDRRRALHRDLEQPFARAAGLAPADADADSGSARTAAFDRAVGLIRGPLREALTVRQEADGVRARYGETAAGRGLLAARRLVESGVRCSEVVLGGWDDHQNIFERMPNRVRELDRALAALIDDLEERSLLDSTLVLVMGEFGRTPDINAREGRDHYPGVFSALLAGGGIKGGTVVGSSTSDGRRVADRPVTVAELLATVVGRFGIGPDEMRYAGDRPIRIVDDAKPIAELAL